MEKLYFCCSQRMNLKYTVGFFVRDSRWLMSSDSDVREQHGNKVIGPFRHFRCCGMTFVDVENEENSKQNTAAVRPRIAL